ncbi:sulfotransferase domain-containing protein [Nocardioides panacisoli]|uniref:sulfotransferase domain-containing protein n=1 Tax=Nocardioides panacisoli TaxID=627624 RepID=UPI001C62B97B|nr:sulfotransferase domain-containing protein [Nocardioides panacisoli]QYJ03939.1 sulfotransferase domain-containing protein [Nocardioides panacisoli]
MTEIVGDDDRSPATLWAEEKLRRFSAAATHRILLRRGTELGMWVGCGFPKSGTNWLCELVGTSLGLPVPVDYQLPLMFRAVVHSHHLYDERTPPTVYIRRDGRDVMTSFYFYWTRAARMNKNPRFAQGLRDIFEDLYGPGFDPDDVRGNMPRFIEYQMTVAPTTHGVTWQQHVRDWWDRPGVGHVSFEGLHADPVEEVTRAIGAACGTEPDRDLVQLAVDRHDFARAAGRRSGEEDRRAFRRQGAAGDWRRHFTREAGEVFDSFAGADLVDFGYADDRHWYADL